MRKMEYIYRYVFVFASILSASCGGGNGGNDPVEVASSIQATLGPLSGAEIKAYLVSDIQSPIESTRAKSSNRNIEVAGSFDLSLTGIPDGEWVLVTASGGEDIDADDDGVIDDSPVPNSGTIHAVAKAVDWRGGGKINMLTDIAWRQIATLIEEGQIQNISDSLSWVANSLIESDLDGDGDVDYKDLIAFNPRRQDHRESLFVPFEQFIEQDASGFSVLDYMRSGDSEGVVAGVSRIFGGSLDVPVVPGFIPVQAEVLMPENRKGLLASDAKVSSIVSDSAEILDSAAPTLLMAEDSFGRTLLLAYSMPESSVQKVANKLGFKRASLLQKTATPANTEVSTRSTALALVMMSVGGGMSAEDRAALAALVQDAAEFELLAQAVDEAFQADPYFLDTLMTNQAIVSQVRSLAKSVFDQYLAEYGARNQSTTSGDRQSAGGRSALRIPLNGPKEFWFGSPWDDDEPWNWYGDTDQIDVLDPPFIADAVNNEILYALANPTNITYAAEFYSQSGELLGWRLVGRNSTYVQKAINSGAAQTKIWYGKDIDDRVAHIEINKYFFNPENNSRYYSVLALDLIHIAAGILSVVSDASAIHKATDQISRNKKSLVVLRGCGISLFASVNFNTSSLAEFVSGNITSILETSVTQCFIPAAMIVLNDAAADIGKQAAKSAVKFAAKASNPVGWAMMIFDSVNDLAPLGASLYFAESVVGYDLEWADKSLSGVTRNDSRPVENGVVRVVLPIAKFTAMQDAGLAINFDASASTVDIDSGAVATYEWDFGDGASGSGVTVQHTYSSSGTKRVTLTIDDGLGNTAKQILSVKVTNGHAPVVTNPVCGLVPWNETRLNFDADITDPDGDLKEVRWYMSASDLEPAIITPPDFVGGVVFQYPDDAIASYIPAVQAIDQAGNVSDKVVCMESQSVSGGIDVSAGLVAYYPLDGEAADASGNSNDGESSGVIEYTPGVKGSAARFNGGSMILTRDPFSSDAQELESMSVSLWAKTTSTKVVNGVVSQWSACESGNDNWYMAIYSGDRGLMARVSEENDAINIRPELVSDGKWHHLSFTYDGLQLAFYVDGKIEAQAPVSPGRQYKPGTPLAIGGFYSSSCPNDHYFIGDIDEVRIYNRPLSSSEIQVLYEEGAVSKGSLTTLFYDDFNDNNYTVNPAWTLQNNDDYPGSVSVANGYLNFIRTGAGGNGGGVGVDINVDISVDDSTVVIFDALAESRSVASGCGYTCNEYPVNVQLYLEGLSGDEYIVKYSFNYGGAYQNTSKANFKRIAASIPQGAWEKNIKFRLRDAWPQAVRLTRVYLFGNGWDFNGGIDNFVIGRVDQR